MRKQKTWVGRYLIKKTKRLELMILGNKDKFRQLFYNMSRQIKRVLNPIVKGVWVQQNNICMAHK